MLCVIALSQICQRERYRSVDANKANEIAKSMQYQGLFQPIGVKPCTCTAYPAPHYQLLFGAHRLAAAHQLQWEAIDATVFEANISDDRARLVELQENSARNDLTGAQRKQYVAEIGRISAILGLDRNSANSRAGWLKHLADQSHVPLRTMEAWWSRFCEENTLSLTPSQALDIHKEQFFDWLEEQNRKAEEEKARKAAEERATRQERDCAEAVEYLCELAVEYGIDVVETAIIAVFRTTYAERVAGAVAQGDEHHA